MADENYEVFKVWDGVVIHEYGWKEVRAGVVVNEVIAFKGKPSDYDRDMVNGYLLKKWTSVELPADHPYEIYSHASRLGKAWLRLKARIRRNLRRFQCAF